MNTHDTQKQIQRMEAELQALIQKRNDARGKAPYLEKHPVIRFTTLWEEEQYAIFAVLRMPTDPTKDGFVNYYAHPTFASDAAFVQYIDALRRNALQTADIDVRPGDALLTLATCLGDDRLIVVARRMQTDETEDELISINAPSSVSAY